jgi:hypothetical protein
VTKEKAVYTGDPPISSHACLAHYLVDGHHKVFAAGKARLPLILISFLAIDKGISSTDEIEQVIKGISPDH